MLSSESEYISVAVMRATLHAVHAAKVYTHGGAHDAQAALDDVDVPDRLGVFYRTPPLRCWGGHLGAFWSEVCNSSLRTVTLRERTIKTCRTVSSISHLEASDEKKGDYSYQSA